MQERDYIGSQQKGQQQTAFGARGHHHNAPIDVYTIFIIACCAVILLGFLYYRVMRPKMATSELLKFLYLFTALTAIFFVIYLNVHEY